MNFRFSIGRARCVGLLVASVFSALMLSSCSKNPAELQEKGMEAFSAGEYAKAQEYFADGIKKEGNTQLYAGFIAANLVTGKYPEINAAYNQYSDEIHSYLMHLYGKSLFENLGITAELIPYKVNGGNRLPPDYPHTIVLQSNAAFDGYVKLKGEIDGVLRK